MQKTQWYAFLIAVGAASTAAEMTGLRLLAPLFGSSLPVWGSAIAIVIAGLAWGYAQGGARAEHEVSATLVFRHAALAAALFLWMPPLFRAAAYLRETYFTTGTTTTLIGALCVAGIALLLPALTFGMVTPLAVQVEAKRQHQPAGHVAGRVFTLTTVGSLVGILIPSFITIPILGTRQTIWLFAGIVLTLSAYALIRNKRIKPTLILLALMPVGISTISEKKDPTILHTEETPYQHVTVYERNNARYLTFDASFGIQSVTSNQLYTKGYWDYAAALPALLPQKDPLRVLVLGAAASTAERQLQRFWEEKRTFEFTSVELDSALPAIAQTYFDPPKRNIVIADARMFANSDNNHYDLIILDTYTRELTVPFHLTTKEFFTELKPRLAPNGILAININANSQDTRWIRSISATLATTFPSIELAAIPHTCNHLFIAGETPLTQTIPTEDVPPSVHEHLAPLITAQKPRTDGIILTDNRAPTDLLGILALATTQAESCT